MRGFEEKTFLCMVVSMDLVGVIFIFLGGVLDYHMGGWGVSLRTLGLWISRRCCLHVTKG